MIVKLLGDVHLGKRFESGVPLHRRGDREALQWAQFERDLLEPCDLHIQMGDLFDKFVVPYSVVWGAAQAYISAAQNSKAEFVVLRGNHDASRDLEKVSAFQLFKGLVEPHGIIVVDERPFEVSPGYVVFPWHPVRTAIEMVELLQGDYTDAVCEAFGHWDVVMGEDNQLPAAALKAKGFSKAYTGHDHVARDLALEGLDVRVVGSMQPYSHAEDPDHLLYVTLSLAELSGADVKDKCVRLMLQPGEVLDFPVDCLQLSIQRGQVEDVEMEVDFEAFDLKSLFYQACEQAGLSEQFSDVVYGKLEAERVSRN